jgi:glycosyltransferase involved in cell wall biosynthesis
MRVLYVIDALGEGGAEMSLAELLPPLAAAGISPTIVCLKSRGGEGVQDRLVGDGFDVRVLRPGRLTSQARQTAAVARAIDADLIHTTLYQANLVGAVAGARTRTPVVRSLVNTSYAPERLADPRLAAGRMRVTKVVDGFTARHLTRALHAISHAVKAHAVETLGVPADRITVVGRGRDPERLGSPSAARRQAARAMLDIPPETEVLVNVARQEYQKGQRHLLDAMALLASHRPNVTLIVAGRQGTVTAELERRAADPAIAERVRFLGHRKDVPDVLAAGDVFVFPSLYEGFGGALLEAMALGLPIVASDIPAVREVVDDGANAILVPPGDAQALATAIDGLLDDADRRQAFGARGRTMFCERFVLDRVAEQMLAFYADTVTRP